MQRFMKSPQIGYDTAMNRITPAIALGIVLVFTSCKDANKTSATSTSTTTTTTPAATPPAAPTPAPAAINYTPPTTPYVPAGYAITKFLSDKPVREFKDFENTLSDNTDYQAVIETNKGRMVADLFEDDTPTTIANFVFLAQHHYYDGLTWHRVIQDFMAQGGDPQGTGTGGPGYKFGDEIRQKIKFDAPGLLAMANSGPATNGSQFFITFKNTDWLNGKHTIFGKLVEGSDVLNNLTRTEGNAGAVPDKMLKIYIVEKKK